MGMVGTRRVARMRQCVHARDTTPVRSVARDRQTDSSM